MLLELPSGATRALAGPATCLGWSAEQHLAVGEPGALRILSPAGNGNVRTGSAQLPSRTGSLHRS